MNTQFLFLCLLLPLRSLALFEPIEEVDLEASDVVMDIPLRSLERERRPTISYDYIIYLQEHEYDVLDVSDSTTYKEAIVSP